VALLSGQIHSTTGGSVGSVNQLPPVAPVGRVFLATRRFEQGPAKASIQSQQAARIDPLYLFHCSLLWHTESDTGAGWELIGGLRSSDRDTRAVAATLLSKTEDARLLVRDLRRTRSGTQQPRSGAYPSFRESSNETNEAPMNTPYGLEVIESCLTCQLRKDKWFCGLSPELLKLLSAASRPATYPGGALLFVEGQVPRNALVLCSGRAKLSTTSRDGKVLILKVAEAGDVLGLSAAITGTPYEVTAETVGPCHVNFIDREPLLRLMERNGEMGVHAAQALSVEFQSMYRDIHELVLARSSAGKLARLLLSWSGGRGKDLASSEVRIRAIMTHEEMAQMIGASRETVTRLLSELKKKELIRLEGATLVIRNRVALEAIAA